MEEMEAKSAFEAIIRKIQTVRGGDGAFRVTLDVPLSCKKDIKELFDVDEHEVIYVAIVRKFSKEEKKDSELRTEVKSSMTFGV